MAGAEPLEAKPYRVRLAIYKSELAAEKTKSKMAALRICGRVGMPAALIATTKGEAPAPVFALRAL